MATLSPGIVAAADLTTLTERCQIETTTCPYFPGRNAQIIFDADPSQFQTDSTLRRYLRAFGNIDDAFKAILQTNQWRKEYCVNSLSPVHEDIVEEILTNKAIILGKRDLCERPVVFVAVRKHNVYERDVDKLTKFLVYMLETACNKCNEAVIDNICLIFDLKDFTLSCMDYQFIKRLIWLLSKHYPERLGVCLILNSPLLFSGCWTVIRPWLNEVTASKVKFISDSTQLAEHIDPDSLPD